MAYINVCYSNNPYQYFTLYENGELINEASGLVLSTYDNSKILTDFSTYSSLEKWSLPYPADQYNNIYNGYLRKCLGFRN